MTEASASNTPKPTPTLMEDLENLYVIGGLDDEFERLRAALERLEKLEKSRVYVGGKSGETFNADDVDALLEEAARDDMDALRAEVAGLKTKLEEAEKYAGFANARMMESITRTNTAESRATELAARVTELAEAKEALERDRDNARRTSAYWKDEHLAGNIVIDQLAAQIESLSEGIGQIIAHVRLVGDNDNHHWYRTHAFKLLSSIPAADLAAKQATEAKHSALEAIGRHLSEIFHHEHRSVTAFDMDALDDALGITRQEVWDKYPARWDEHDDRIRREALEEAARKITFWLTNRFTVSEYKLASPFDIKAWVEIILAPHAGKKGEGE